MILAEEIDVTRCLCCTGIFSELDQVLFWILMYLAWVAQLTLFS